FGLDRLITTQTLILCTPLALGLVMKGNIEYALLAVLLVALIIGFRVLAADVRAYLLQAVHGRVEASRLAEELDAALDTMQHGLCMLDASGVITIINDHALETLAELAPGDWAGRSFADFIAAAEANGTLPRM